MTTSLPDHINTPHLRPVQPIPITREGKTFVALRDPIMLSTETMVVPPQVLQIVQYFRGDKSLEEIAGLFSGSLEQLTALASGLDKIGLLWGPTFEEMEQSLRERIDEAGAFAPRATTAMGEDADTCRASIERALEQTDEPEIDGAVIGVVAPHLDYQRGWPNYAAAHHCLKRPDPVDRIVILGTNHFGIGDGVVLTEYGFETPMGRCPPDGDVIDGLVSKLGRPAIVDQLDHLPEHSIELQLPWLQYHFGDVPIVAALIPDPLSPPIEEEGRVTCEQFIETLGETLAAAGGSTFFVASSDLSHVGPQFGEPRPVDEQRRFDVERHDREMLEKYIDRDAEAFLAAMRWNKNPTRWCSIGNMWAVLQLAQPQRLELIDYRQACDEQGFAMVTSAAIALVG